MTESLQKRLRSFAAWLAKDDSVPVVPLEPPAPHLLEPPAPHLQDHGAHGLPARQFHDIAHASSVTASPGEWVAVTIDPKRKPVLRHVGVCPVCGWETDRLPRRRTAEIRLERHFLDSHALFRVVAIQREVREYAMHSSDVAVAGDYLIAVQPDRAAKPRVELHSIHVGTVNRAPAEDEACERPGCGHRLDEHNADRGFCGRPECGCGRYLPEVASSELEQEGAADGVPAVRDELER